MSNNSIESENFLDLLEESFSNTKLKEGNVVKGTIVGIENDFAIIDVGLKSEGRILLREFGSSKDTPLKIGDTVDVFIERMENRDGEIVLSREKARREAAWEDLEVLHKNKERVNGVISARVKGGFTVDLVGALAFLPGSQVDVRAIKDTRSLMNIEQPFMILKMDRLRGNIVVSRRAILEESRTEAMAEALANIKEGQVLDGFVKNLTDYGAFIDLGGFDGLLHLTDIVWHRINHPSEILQVGQDVKVLVTRISDTNRISLGMKQLESDPWKDIESRYIKGSEVEGVVNNIMDYGVFVKLELGVEGLIHASELSWTKKNVHPNKILSAQDTVRVRVLDVDHAKRRISLSLRQTVQNPWESFAESHKVDDVIQGEIKNTTEFGLFIGLSEGIDGMVHISDLSWDSKSPESSLEAYKKGDMISVKILEISAEKERISLGIKQLTEDPFTSVATAKKGDILTCTVQLITDKGIDVVTEKGVSGFIRKADLARDRNEQRTDRFAVNERVDAQVLSVDPKTRKLSLSIKAREISEEQQAMDAYGSSDSGASLGDILGAAINLKKVKDEESKNIKPSASLDESSKESKSSKKKADIGSDEKVKETDSSKETKPKKELKKKSESENDMDDSSTDTEI